MNQNEGAFNITTWGTSSLYIRRSFYNEGEDECHDVEGLESAGRVEGRKENKGEYPTDKTGALNKKRREEYNLTIEHRNEDKKHYNAKNFWT